MKLAAALVIFGIAMLSGCGIPKEVSLDDPRVVPLMEARSKIDLASRGFTPITGTRARLEVASFGPYDVMLHISGKTIAFKKDKGGYRWIGEQEIFQGVREYKTPDGPAIESLCFNYDLERVSSVCRRLRVKRCVLHWPSI